MLARIVALLLIPLVGCAGHWGHVSSSSSTQRSNAQVSAWVDVPRIEYLAYPEEDAQGVIRGGTFQFLVELDVQRCNATWDEVTTTTTRERFRTDRSGTLWLGLGTLAVIAGAIPLAAGGPAAIGYPLIGLGVIEMSFGLANLISSARHRSRTSTDTTAQGGATDCDPSLFDASAYQLVTPWGATVAGARWSEVQNIHGQAIGSCLAFAQVTPPQVTRGELATTLVSRPFEVQHPATGQAWSVALQGDASSHERKRFRTLVACNPDP